ncbi:type II toxin-antitoxin system PemK/MazF family toxin [Thioalkalivibrio paradoxus]|uniref:MazF family transcriptional regulator n=1 Tax=Thioalkalivibrio paradoxus ARh 1 TaxID=713585 RepID=W0DN15_9GAMM|nr:type II toxin-antitoxin system PemK/MazF family toxin [Thioalkalivibrio paradoxus]AHE98270.1 MazF family transcriptional regulator [Thioalkalivibrio paradoxus ARh 1]
MAPRYIPDRSDIVFLDFEPPKGREIGEYRPALVLSSKEYNRNTGLLICCPISTSIRGAPTEVPIDHLDQPSVVAANLVHTLDWKARKIERVARGSEQLLEEVLMRLLPLIGAGRFLDHSFRAS